MSSSGAETESTEITAPQSAVERAKEFGIDISLLIDNLRLTPTERVRRMQHFANDLLVLQQAVREADRKKQHNAVSL